MQISTNRSALARASGIAVTFFVVLAPLSAVAQRAGSIAVDAPRRAQSAGSTTAAATAPPPFLQSVLRDIAPQSPVAAPRVQPGVARVLNEAIAALNAKKYADARVLLAELELDRLSPYELGVAETTFFYVAYLEGMLGEARQHLLNAIASGGLTEQEIATARRNMERIDARLAPASLT